jgi:hypothetical protein
MTPDAGQPAAAPARPAAARRLLGAGTGVLGGDGLAAYLHPALGQALAAADVIVPLAIALSCSWRSCGAAARLANVPSACCAGSPTGPNRQRQGEPGPVTAAYVKLRMPRPVDDLLSGDLRAAAASPMAELGELAVGLLPVGRDTRLDGAP